MPAHQEDMVLIGTCFSRAKQRAVPSHTHAHAAAFSGGSTATNPYPPTLYFQTFLHAVDTYFRKTIPVTCRNDRDHCSARFVRETNTPLLLRPTPELKTVLNS